MRLALLAVLDKKKMIAPTSAAQILMAQFKQLQLAKAGLRVTSREGASMA